ncbi:uncharacterized protein LOC107266956 [Cephus cinctus]|uniref:Uncharacterized protein LOC107266956 n=1 Tax=Cephus cinctus TaxID=211228 RepID=A0AAJ7FIK3_CEPCN|nr:uncharacterized protein LOC107266956 [Cephus cinctus]
MSCVEEGFRLGGAPSECSLKSKARIDALFEDSKSVWSSTLGGWYAAVSTMASTNPEDIGTEEQKRVNSAVQARIEAMFASVEAEHAVPGESAAAILSVKYMGAAPVGGRVASVRGLQEPLRQLLERLEDSIAAELEVSRRGLTFRTSDSNEKTNPFRRIAVWSALRLRSKESASGELHHAFLPLVGDEQGIGSKDKHADLYRTMRGLKEDVNEYPPIFAVVMRRPGAARVLECHAFACQVEEDAIAAAATLYRALLADLDANRRRPRQANGVGCVSLASVASSVREQSLGMPSRNFRQAPPRPTAPHPVRPPRVKKTSISSITEDEPSSSGLEAPRRKKKIPDVKADDILEGRSRRQSADLTSGVKQMRTGTSSVVDKEEKENLRNKLYDVSKDIYGEVDKLYGNNAKEADSRKLNKYERLPIKRCEVWNSSDQVDRIEEDRNRESKTKQINEIYMKNQGSYDLTRISRSKSNLALETYSTKKPGTKLYDRKEEANVRLNSRQSGIYDQEELTRRNHQGARHHDDADKIYSINQEDVSFPKNSEIYSSRSTNGVSQKSNKSRPSSSMDFHPREKITKQNVEAARSQEDLYGQKRLSRISTMDKHVRNTRSECNDTKMVEYSQPRARKTSRAGSEPPRCRSEEATRMIEENKLKRAQSDLDVDRGDLMTRVELPRRGSFLNTGNTRRPNNITGGTPLGFTELFDEFRNQEGLTSVDDILAAIIDPEGMSFNDLKPLYKEFLLKLAATLTQDELYQRSASIMRRRRRPQRRRSTRRSCLLGRAIKRSVSRLKGGPTEFTSVIFPARRLNDSFGSSSSCDAKNNHRNRVLGSRLGRRRSSWRRMKAGIGQTTSEDSDTCKRLGRGVAANRSSSGYVSCSECSYDSESCTCVSADKCYCSLSRRIPVPPAPGNTTVCACDTDSCSESNKCYCARSSAQPSILEQLRQRGIVPSESTLSRGGSPERVKTSKTNRSLASSRSLEFLKVRPSPTPGSSDNLALDYDLFSPGKASQKSSSSEKVLVVSARDPQGRLVYVGGAERAKRPSLNGSNRSVGHHEALSIKKSAEIAAVFGLNSGMSCRRAGSISSVRSSISLEAGLGYLP